MEADQELREVLGERTHVAQDANGIKVTFSPEVVKLVEYCFKGHTDVTQMATRDIIVLATQMYLHPERRAATSQLNGATATIALGRSNEVIGGNNTGKGQKSTPTDPATIQSRSPAANDAGAVETEILLGAAKGRYVVHPVARMFPMILGQGYDELVQSLKEYGQQEDCVVDGNTLLDGRNRVNGLNQLEREVRVVQFAELKTGLSPADWIMVKNLQRRHLTNDQYLAITAKFLAWSKDQAERRQADADPKQSAQGEGETTAEGHPQDADGSADGEYPQKAAENTSKGKRGRPRGNRSEAEKLAKKTKQSRYRAEQMMKLRAQAPELATEVEKGRMTLTKAIKKLKAVAHEGEPHPKDHDGLDGIVKVVEKAKQGLLKLVDKLEATDQASFWKQVVEFAKSQTGEDAAAK
jgi:hypothetical protein